MRRRLVLVAPVVVFGVAGYMLLEGWPFVDEIYIVLTTVATIGYGEIRPLLPLGRAVTMVLILLGAGIILTRRRR